MTERGENVEDSLDSEDELATELAEERTEQQALAVPGNCYEQMMIHAEVEDYAIHDSEEAAKAIEADRDRV